MAGYRTLIAFCTLILISGCQTWPPSDIGQLPAPAALPMTSTPGEVEVYYWDNVAGVTVDNITSLESFPDNPDQIGKLNQLEGVTSRGENYGTLVRGYIQPPQAGSYRFALSGDDYTEFWLGISDDPATKRRIASVPGYTSQRQYNKYSSQISQFIDLEAGERYYFEVIHKESGGGDHYSVAWEGPGFARQIIGGSSIASYADSKQDTQAPTSVEESYRKGYAVGYLDGTEGLRFAPTYPPMDNDGDGLYDNWEVAHGLDADNPNDANTDPDNDLLIAADEFLLGTAENNSDTDGDGIPDGNEFAYSLDPLDASDALGDLDSDGVNNLNEYIAGSNPSVPDAIEEELAISPELSTFRGVAGQYFQGMDFDQFLIARQEPAIQFTPGRGPIVPEQQNNNFSSRWYGVFTAIHANGSRNYTFTVRTDDGARLYLDGEQVISSWRNQGATSYSATVPLEAGQAVRLLMEHYENTGGTVAELFITDESTNTSLALSDVVQSPDLQTSAAVDTDKDGIPDTWELRNGLNPWNDDASAVYNSAGMTSIEAYQSSVSPWTLEAVATPQSPTVDEGVITEPVAPDQYTVTLSWIAPLTRVDGSSIALSEIQSYEILYGQSSDNLSEVVTVDGSETSATIPGLTAGTWYFSIRVVDSEGLKSELSETITYSLPEQQFE